MEELRRSYHRDLDKARADLALLAAKVAELKGISVGELEAATTENFFRLFAKAERGACG